MYVYNLSKHVICEKLSFLHSLDVLIKMFTNSLAVLNQQKLGRTDHVHCFQAQLTESCLDFGFDSRLKLFFLYKKQPVYPVYPGSELMVYGLC